MKSFKEYYGYEGIEIKGITASENGLLQLLLEADPSRDSIADYLDRGDLYGAFQENALVGAYILIKTRPLTMELVNVSVKEEFQGRGIGKLLVMDAIKKARGASMKTLELGTGNSSINQLALYQKCGFRIKTVDIDFFKRHYKEAILENGIPCLDMLRLGIDL